MDIKLAPSIARGDLLNLEKEIRLMEEAEVDLIHFDLKDTSYSVYGQSILLSTDMIPMFREITDIPLDIHFLLEYPERLMDVVLPYCEGYYVTVQAEVCYHNLGKLVKMIKNSGGKPGIALNVGTPISVIYEVIPFIDMVNIMLREDFESNEPLSEQILDKILRTRKFLDDNGGKHISIEVDGSIGMDEIAPLIDKGANILVLGTKTIFTPNAKSYVKNCENIRKIFQK